MGGIAVIATTSTTNDLLHHQSMPSMHWLVVFNRHKQAASMSYHHCNLLAVLHSFICFWSKCKTVKEKNEIFSRVTWVALLSLPQQAPQMTCCIVH